MGPLVAVHTVIGYAMTGGLASKPIETINPAIQTQIIQEMPRQPVKPPPIPRPRMKDPRIVVPPPEIDIEIAAETLVGTTYVGTGTGTEEFSPPPSGRALKPAQRYIVHARIGKNFPDPDAFYPSASIRREEQGLASVQVCVGPDGKLATDPLVVQTSGSDRLDDAALKLARSGHYLAGSVDGMPIFDCLQLPIRFKMKS